MNGAQSESRRWYFIVAAVGFATAIVAFAPAGLAAVAMRRAAPLAATAGAEGTLWKGRLLGVTYGDIAIGDIDFRLRATSLPLGRAVVDIASTNGALEGAGRLRVTPSALEFGDVSAAFNLGSIRRYSFFGVPYQGALSVKAERLRLTNAGCEAESATISTSAFDALSHRWSGGAFPMEGVIKCQDGALVASLRGEGADGTAELHVRVRPDLSYALTVSAQTRKPDVSRALEFFGFEKGGDGLSYKAVGVLKGLNS